MEGFALIHLRYTREIQCYTLNNKCKCHLIIKKNQLKKDTHYQNRCLTLQKSYFSMAIVLLLNGFRRQSIIKQTPISYKDRSTR